jgi:hypothetical protein
VKIVVAAAALCGACFFTGARSSYVPKGPAHAAGAGFASAGDPLLQDVPSGADVLIEIDLARLYANPTLGAAAKQALAAPGDAVSLPGFLLPRGASPLAGASAIVLAAYSVGTADATTLTLVATRAQIPNGTAIADGVVALAPPEMIARAQEVVAGRAASVAGDKAMMSVRARAVPDGAPGATLRASARLDLDARVALAPVLGPDLAPATLSLWADVADDAAVVAILDGHDAAGGGGSRLLAALERMRVALAGSTTLLELGLAPTVKDATIVRSGDLVRVVATIGPKRLSALAAKLYPAAP